MLAIAEGGVLVGEGADNPALPGQYMFGGYFDTSDYVPFADPEKTVAGNWGLYALANQMVYEEKEYQGLSLWGFFSRLPSTKHQLVSL